MEALSFVYPVKVPPATLPEGTALVPYSQPLVAIGGTGPYRWTFAGDGSNPGDDDFGHFGLYILDGAISGVPDAAGCESALIKATDVNGDSHTKRFYLGVVPAGATTTTSTSTTTTTVPPVSLEVRAVAVLTLRRRVIARVGARQAAALEKLAEGLIFRVDLTRRGF